MKRHLLTCLLPVCLFACAAFPLSAADADGAVVAVAGDKPLSRGTLKATAPIHTNRSYIYRDVPKAFRGMSYLLHEHKNPSAIALEVKKAGALFLCLWDGVTPEQLGLDGAWSEAATFPVIIAGRRYDAAVFGAELATGKTLKIKSVNKWGSVIVARKIEGVPETTGGTAPGAGGTAPGGEYDRLKRLMVESRTWDLRRLEREAVSREALLLPSDKTPVDVILRRTRALLGDIEGMAGAPGLEKEKDRLAAYEQDERRSGTEAERRDLFGAIAALRRTIAFKNPLLDFERIIFLTHHKSTYNHMCDQYYGFKARPGGGLFVLDDPFGENPAARDLLADAVVTNGRLKGRTLAGGTFISLELDYDAETILFGYSECGPGKGTWAPEKSFHVFRVDADGGNLVQLTDGPFNEFDPCVLPSGRIAFVSERIGGYLRCGGRPCPTYTLHGMMPDGSDIINLSFHETHEWHPSVDHEGKIVYTRWDYVDRDSDIAHHIWHCYPDGRDPRSYHGNYPVSRESRPWMEMSIRAVPGSGKYVAVSAPHHGQAYGSIILIDLKKKDDRSTSQVLRLTPEVPFPESEKAPGVPHKKGTHRPRAEVYGTPWPLGEKYHLCVYDPAQKHYGIFLVDAFGNKIPIYRDPVVPCLDPIPFRPRKRPPVIPPQTRYAAADRDGSPVPATGTVAVMNVYVSDREWPAGTKITSLRVVNLFPKATPSQGKPEIGHAAQSLARGVLGTVPVESDGSACFTVPAGVPIYFQALDENGLCVQNMRSATYVHPGETLSCEGCHEPKNEPPKNIDRDISLALKRTPSQLEPEPAGSYPLTFPRLVQPVLDARCVTCHEKKKKAPSLRGDRFGKHGWSEAFCTLNRFAWGKHGGNGAIRRNGRSYSIPGREGARVAKLYTHLAKGHHDVELTAEQMRRITLWLDCNSNFYGAYFETGTQARGAVIKPKLGLPAGIPFEDLVR